MAPERKSGSERTLMHGEWMTVQLADPFGLPATVCSVHLQQYHTGRELGTACWIRVANRRDKHVHGGHTRPRMFDLACLR